MESRTFNEKLEHVQCKAEFLQYDGGKLAMESWKYCNGKSGILQLKAGNLAIENKTSRAENIQYCSENPETLQLKTEVVRW